MNQKTQWIILSLILILGIFFRFWKLKEIPPGLYPDVAIYANDALDSLLSKKFKVFYPENNGREGFWMWILALFFKIFGVSIFTIKLAAAVCGFLTIIGIYLLVKELFEEEKLALFSTFFLSISFWHTIFSRIGFRVITYPLLLVFALYFFIKALKRLKFFYFCLGGFLFGLSFYTYTSIRLQVLNLPILFFALFQKDKEKKRIIFGLFLFVIFTFFTALPLGIYFLKNPYYFTSRMTPISIFSGEKKLVNFFNSLILHLLMLNFYGDPNLRHNIPTKPYLSPIESLFFLMGFLVCLHSILKKKESFKKYLFLISFWFISLLPGILTKEGIPHGIRSFGAVLPSSILSALGISVFEKKIKNYKFSKIIIFFLILLLIVNYYQRYFIYWAKSPDLKNAFSQNLVEIGNYLNSLPKNYEKYVVVNMSGVPVPFPHGIPMPAQTVMFMERTKFGETKSHYLLPESLDQIKIRERGVIVIMKEEEELLKKILKLFPNGKLKKQAEFLAIEINQF